METTTNQYGHLTIVNYVINLICYKVMSTND